MSVRKLLLPLLLLWPLALWAANNADNDEFIEGINYQRIVPAQPGGSDGTVEVTELFWYGCPHCFHFEPYLKRWLAAKPDYVKFRRVPAIFSNPRWRLDAHAFYVADALGVLDKIHSDLFDAIHMDHKPMATKGQLEDFFVQHGVARQDFESTWDSFAVESDLRRAADLTKDYGIDGVPTIVVNGKYRVDGPLAGSYDNLIKILNFLVRKEHTAADRN